MSFCINNKSSSSNFGQEDEIDTKELIPKTHLLRYYEILIGFQFKTPLKNVRQCGQTTQNEVFIKQYKWLVKLLGELSKIVSLVVIHSKKLDISILNGETNYYRHPHDRLQII